MLEVVFDEGVFSLLQEAISKGSFDDVSYVGFYLDIGSIATEEQYCTRVEVFDYLWETHGFTKEERQAFLQERVQAEEKLIQAANNKEGIRIWVSDTPSDMCGLAYVCYLLEHIECELWIRKLPGYQVSEDNIQLYEAWDEIPYDRLIMLDVIDEYLPNEVKQWQYAAMWKQLMKENAPMRAYLNGRLVSVAENFYDDIIERCVPKQAITILELIGRILNHGLHGLHFDVIRQRIQVMLMDGKLSMVEKSEKDSMLDRIARTTN